MKKIYKFIFGIGCIIYSVNALAIQYTLAPHAKFYYVNIWFFKATIKTYVIKSKEPHRVSFTGQGMINSDTLQHGQSLSKDLNSHEWYLVTLPPYAKIELTNDDDAPLTIDYN